MPQLLQAGIVGAGIGGLAAAVALRNATGIEWDIEIFERSKSRSESGAAITATPNATRHLMRWGFDFESTQPDPHTWIEMHNAQDLSSLGFDDMPNLKNEFGGGDCLSFHRVDLHRGLLDLATKPTHADTNNSTRGGKGKVNVRLACEVVSVDCEAGILRLADGTELKKDLIIIADGSHSHLVSAIVGKETPLVDTGKSAFRCLIPTERILNSSFDDVKALRLFRSPRKGLEGFVHFASGQSMVMYCCRGSTVLNVAFLHQNTRKDEDLPDTWHSTVPLEEVLEVAKVFHPTLRNLLSLADNVGVYNLMIREPLDTFNRGRAVVIGDAAHLMLPYYAAGAGTTIESAGFLETLLSEAAANLTSSSTSSASSSSLSDSIPAILDKFSATRIPRANMTQILSNAGSYHQQDPEVVAKVRRFYDGEIPPGRAGPWAEEFRELFFRVQDWEPKVV